MLPISLEYVGTSQTDVGVFVTSTDAIVWRNAIMLQADGLLHGMDVFARAGVITDVAPTGSKIAEHNDVVECHGQVMLPAFANAHHHFYSAFLRGLPPLPSPPRSQRERLERLVWPYERRLTESMVRASVRVGLLEATVAGTTTIIDHHASAGCVDGILDVIAEEVQAAGLRGVLCYEITNRDGDEIASAGLRETERFLARGDRENAYCAGMVGLHAMSTVDDATLADAVAIARQYAVGLHLHLGEAAFDAELCVARYGQRPLERLDRYQALNAMCLIAHAIDVTAEERAVMAKRNVMVVHNPRSNASNGLGPLDIEAFRRSGIIVGLGGDGFTQDMRGELPLATLLQRQGQQSPRVLAPATAIDLGVRGNAEIVARATGWKMGTIAPGYAADLIVFDGEPTIPLAAENAEWHLASGLPGLHVRDVFVAGRAILRKGHPILLDAERIVSEANAAIPGIWRRTTKEFEAQTHVRNGNAQNSISGSG
jgi:cytosine/adenosine deaminase-related metal-dependent hydrolase